MTEKNELQASSYFAMVFHSGVPRGQRNTFRREQFRDGASVLRQQRRHEDSDVSHSQEGDSDLL